MIATAHANTLHNHLVQTRHKGLKSANKTISTPKAVSTFKFSYLLILSTSALIGCEPTTYPDLETGKELYEFHCQRCHAKNGAGMMMKGVSPKRLKEIHLDGLRTQVKEGRGMMPSFSKMPEHQIVKISEFLKKKRTTHRTLADNAPNRAFLH